MIVIPILAIAMILGFSTQSPEQKGYDAVMAVGVFVPPLLVVGAYCAKNEGTCKAPQ